MTRTSPKRSKIRQSQADVRFLTEPSGLPLHNADFYERVRTPLSGAIK